MSELFPGIFGGGAFGPFSQQLLNAAYQAQQQVAYQAQQAQQQAAQPREVHKGDLKIIDVESEEVKPVLLLPAPGKASDAD